MSRRKKQLVTKTDFNSSPYRTVKRVINLLGFDVRQGSVSIQKSDGTYTTLSIGCSDSLLKGHLDHDYSICLPRYQFTKIFCLDVDCKDGNLEKTKKAVIQSINELKCNPVLIEKSTKADGGYHIYFKFNKSHKSINHLWSYFPKYMKQKYKMDVEVIKGDLKLKLPFSIHYSNYGTYDESSETLIKSLNIEECLDNVEFTGHTELNSAVFSKLKEMYKIDVSNKVFEVPEKVFDKYEHCRGSRYNSSRFNDRENWKDYGYGRGERWEMQKKIAYRAAAQGLSFSDFIYECNIYDHGSKDMEEWRRKGTLEKNLRSIYEYFTAHVSPSTPLKQQQKDSKKERRTDLVMIENPNYILSKKSEDALYSALSAEVDFKKGKPKESFITGCIKLYKVLLALYKQRGTYLGEFYFLNKGVLVDRKLLNKIGVEYHIDNVEDRFKFLRKNKLIKKISRKSDGLTYCYKKGEVHFATHYEFKSLEKFINRVKKKIAEKMDPLWKSMCTYTVGRKRKSLALKRYEKEIEEMYKDLIEVGDSC